MFPQTTPRSFDPARYLAQSLVKTWAENNRLKIRTPALNTLIDRIAEICRGQTLRAPRVQGEQRTLDIGTPMQIAEPRDYQADQRSPDCPAYELCLEHACRRGWRGFSCRACGGPGTIISGKGRVRTVRRRRRLEAHAGISS